MAAVMSRHGVAARVEQCALCESSATSTVPRRGAPPLPLCTTHRAQFDARLARLDHGLKADA